MKQAEEGLAVTLGISSNAELKSLQKYTRAQMLAHITADLVTSHSDFNKCTLRHCITMLVFRNKENVLLEAVIILRNVLKKITKPTQIQ